MCARRRAGTHRAADKPYPIRQQSEFLSCARARAARSSPAMSRHRRACRGLSRAPMEAVEPFCVDHRQARSRRRGCGHVLPLSRRRNHQRRAMDDVNAFGRRQRRLIVRRRSIWQSSWRQSQQPSPPSPSPRPQDRVIAQAAIALGSARGRRGYVRWKAMALARVLRTARAASKPTSAPRIVVPPDQAAIAAWPAPLRKSAARQREDSQPTSCCKARAMESAVLAPPCHASCQHATRSDALHAGGAHARAQPPAGDRPPHAGPGR